MKIVCNHKKRMEKQIVVDLIFVPKLAMNLNLDNTENKNFPREIIQNTKMSPNFRFTQILSLQVLTKKQNNLSQTAHWREKINKSSLILMKTLVRGKIIKKT